MPDGLIQTTPPTAEPITLQQAKDHARVEVTDDDGLITQLIVSAREYAETVTRRQLMIATWTWTLDRFPGVVGHTWDERHGVHGHHGQHGLDDDVFVVPWPPLRTIVSIKHIDDAGVLQTVPAADYLVDISTEYGRVAPVFGLFWPVARDELGAVRVQFTAGYDNAATVPAQIKQAILLLVGHWYEMREDTTVGPQARSIPSGAARLLGQQRIVAIH